MKILVISPFSIYPINNGFATRTYNIIKQLSSYHEIFLFYINLDRKCINSGVNYLPNVSKCGINTSRRWMQFFHPLLLYKGIKTVKNEHIDIVIAESIWAGLHAMILSSLTKVPYCLTEHNAEYVRWKRMGRNNSYILKKFEKLCCTCSDKIISMSDVDKELIHRLGVDIGKIITIPNGFDNDTFKPNPSSREEIRKKLNVSNETSIILFSGNLNYAPNYQAVQIIHDVLLDKILAIIPTAKFLIVGSNPPLQYKHESIRFTGRVDRIEDYINASDLVIAPLLSGGGTKLKIVEAIACGKSVVTTSIGAEGLICDETAQFLHIFDEWDGFANFIVEFLKNGGSNNSPSEYESFSREYSWVNLGLNLKKALEEFENPQRLDCHL
jgi:polysaccharide biosynthesis protein PslH